MTDGRVDAELADLRLEHALELDRLLEAGLCGCGCGEPIDAGGNGRRRYRDGHRQRAHRRRVEAEAKVRGVPTRLSLKALESTGSTGERHADAQTAPRKPRRPRPGVTVYFPTPRAAEVARRLLEAGSGVIDEQLAIDAAAAAIDAALARRRARG